MLINRYADLVNTLKPDHVLQYLITDNVASIDDSERILAGVTMKDKARKLLDLLADPIKAGYVKGFWSLLEAMEKHGVEAEKELALMIKSDFYDWDETDVETDGAPRGKESKFCHI